MTTQEQLNDLAEKLGYIKAVTELMKWALELKQPLTLFELANKLHTMDEPTS